MNEKRMNYQSNKFLYHEDQDQDKFSILGIYNYLASTQRHNDETLDFKARQISGTRVLFPADIHEYRRRMFLNYTKPALCLEKSKALQIFIKFFYYNIISFDESEDKISEDIIGEELEDKISEDGIGEGIDKWLLEIFIGYISEFDIKHALEELTVANKKSFFILKPELIDVQKYWNYTPEGYYKSNACEHKIGCQCILEKHFWYLLKQIKYEQQITTFEYEDLDLIYDILELIWNEN